MFLPCDRPISWIALGHPPAQSTLFFGRTISMQTLTNAPRRSRSGFTLVELAVVIVIIGVLAAFGVPRFIKSVEKSKASEAFEYLASVRTAQERYQAQYGTYATNVTDLDIKSSAPKYFTVPAVFTASSGGTSLANAWTLTLTRTGSSAGYGAYTVTFTETGFDLTNSTIAAEPTNTDINPIAL
jgi:prepilin-type N-terminal cleavage/methylation domain-containing protein